MKKARRCQFSLFLSLRIFVFYYPAPEHEEGTSYDFHAYAARTARRADRTVAGGNTPGLPTSSCAASRRDAGLHFHAAEFRQDERVNRIIPTPLYRGNPT